MIVTAHDPSYFIPLSEPPRSPGIESITFTPPTLDVSVPLPELYDWQYRHSPDHPVFIFDNPSSSKPNDICVYTWKTVVPVIHRTGRHILSLFNFTLPLDPEHTPVIAVLAAAGIRTPIWPKTSTYWQLVSPDTFTYLTVNLSVLRTGATLFPISPRNSAPAIAHLMETTGVTAILVGDEPSLKRLAAAAFDIIRNSGGSPPNVAQMPAFDDIFLTRSTTVIDTDEFIPPLGWRRQDRAGLIVHSSGPSRDYQICIRSTHGELNAGSTEWPKPVYWSYHALTLMAAFPRELPIF